jgi:hypothetical protein
LPPAGHGADFPRRHHAGPPADVMADPDFETILHDPVRENPNAVKLALRP